MSFKQRLCRCRRDAILRAGPSNLHLAAGAPGQCCLCRAALEPASRQAGKALGAHNGCRWAGRQAQASRHVASTSLLGRAGARESCLMQQQCRQRSGTSGSECSGRQPPPDSTPRKIVRKALPTKDWALHADGHRLEGKTMTCRQAAGACGLRSSGCNRLTPGCQPTRESCPGKKV